MVRAGRMVLCAVLGGMLFAASVSGQSADQDPASVDSYWLGPYFAGLRVTEEHDDPVPEVIYGDCTLPEGEGGCSWPARIETLTTCVLNPIAHETSFAPVSLLRGGGLRTEDEWVYVGTGNRTFLVDTREPELLSAALREARRRSQTAPEPLPPPVYPTTVLRELKRVTAAAERLHGVRAIARETELSPEQVRYRLARRRTARAGGARRRAGPDDVDCEGEAAGPAGRPRPPVPHPNGRKKRDDGGRAAQAGQPRARPHRLRGLLVELVFGTEESPAKPGPPVSIGSAPSSGTRIVLRHRSRPRGRAAKLACPLKGVGGRNAAVPAAWSKSKAEAGPRTRVSRQISIPSRFSS